MEMKQKNSNDEKFKSLEDSPTASSRDDPDKVGLLADGKADNGMAPPPYQEMEVMIVEKPRGPFDKFNLVYCILLLHGVGTLMPWNMFITANDYFVKYKLAPLPDVNGTVPEKSVYQVYFLGLLGFVAQVPNVALNAINLFCQLKGGATTMRIAGSIAIVTAMFIITVLLAIVDSSQWPAGFFWITMVTVVIINMANGIYQNSIYGMAACLPMKYTGAVILGSNISGTLASLISIVSTAIAPDMRTSAIYYFMTAIFVLLVAFDTFFGLQLLPFYRFYADAAKNQRRSDSGSSIPPYWKIFKQCWLQDIGVFLVFFVTLAVFPAVMVGVKSPNPDFFISETYYAGVLCFLLFNVFAVVGNVLASFFQKPGPKYVIIPILLRLLFIPFFMLCNSNPDDRTMPVLFKSDAVYIIGGIIMATTSGYFSSLTMMYAPRNVEQKYQGVAGMMAAFFLILGIFSGITFSLLLTYMIKNVGGGSGAAMSADFISSTAQMLTTAATA